MIWQDAFAALASHSRPRGRGRRTAMWTLSGPGASWAPPPLPHDLPRRSSGGTVAWRGPAVARFSSAS